MLRKVILLIALLLAAIMIIAAIQPDTFRVQRAAAIKAPPERIFALINDFKQWAAWSPWEKMDLAMKKMHSGAATGQGAIYEWEGNDKVGKGRMEIIESTSSRIVIQLDFYPH